MKLPPIVDAGWVLAHHDGVVLADVRWYLDGRSGRDAFTAGHIPGATFVDLEHDLSTPGDATDGIDYGIYERKANGELREIFIRTLNPRDVPADRGIQKATLDTEVSEGSDLLFSVGPGPNGNYSRDWAAMGPIQIR